MAHTYEAPQLQELGNFRQDTGEFIGPHDEQILPLDDHSYEG